MDNKPDQPFNIRIKNWDEINDYSRGMYNTNSQFKFKILVLKYTLCNYSDAHTLGSGTITKEEEHIKQQDKHMKEIKKQYLKTKVKITRNITNMGNKKDVKITIPLKYLSNF